MKAVIYFYRTRLNGRFIRHNICCYGNKNGDINKGDGGKWYGPDRRVINTPNDNEFVREITAQFELVETAYKLYRWTGDSIAAMYQAILAYANILKLRGNKHEPDNQFQRAEVLKRYFNDVWSVIPNSSMYAYAIDNYGKKHFEWYKNDNEIHSGDFLLFIPMKQLTYLGERNNKLLDYIFEKEFDESTREDNIESLTYLPDEINDIKLTDLKVGNTIFDIIINTFYDTNKQKTAHTAITERSAIK